MKRNLDMTRFSLGRACWVIVGAAAAVAGCQERDESEQALAAFEIRAKALQAAQPADAESGFNPRLLRRFRPARTEIAGPPLTQERIDLGRMLYHETRLSKSQELSCNSCHPLGSYGADGKATSTGHKGQQGNRNAPTVYHAAAEFEQFWDGRASDVEAQALGPILNPVEMAAPSEEYVVSVLASMPEYVVAFKRAFPSEMNPVTFKNVGAAIGAFERRLTTRSRWDQYLEGDATALSKREVEGLKAFTNLGCMVCHTGELLGGSMYEKVGAVEPWPNQKDQGRFEVTKKDGDRMMFKVPTLRNISETGPYFHDGSAQSLEQAVHMMGKHQLGLELDEAEVANIIVWLRSLKGELPNDYIAEPTLPKSSPNTPKPDKS
jgi:cytochrome c peroxidase